MNNFKSGDRLIEDAEIYYEEMKSAFEKKRWNIVIRRAQEVVELSLKGILKIACIDYPKIHNVGPLFVKFIKEKNLKVEEKMLEKIQNISEKLAQKRAPAFYGEKIYSEKDAIDAVEGAKEILDFVKNLKIKLKEG
jgi:HEPN domain-containing protein